MSGGSLDYIYHKVNDAADTLDQSYNSPEVRAFAKHLRKVSKALHDIEWVLSADYAHGDEMESIREVLGDSFEAQSYDVLKQDALKIIDKLKEFTDRKK